MKNKNLSLPLDDSHEPLIEAISRRLANEGVNSIMCFPLSAHIIATVIKANEKGIKEALKDFREDSVISKKRKR